LSSDVTLTLPEALGSAGDVLTDVAGNGILSFATPTAYQPLDTDLTNIAALTATSGFLKTDGANTWTVDAEIYTPKHIGITTESTTARGLTLPDDNQLITCTNGAATTITIPAESSIDFPIGTQILIEQQGAGQVTIAITTDALNSAGGLVSTASQYSTLTLIKTASARWLLAGDLA